MSEHEPTQSVTIQSVTFTIPAPYVAGPVELTEGEAAALNQVLAENIRNNFAGQMKRAAEETPARQLTQEDLDKYVESYEFGRRTGGGRVRDPVAAEERRLSLDAIKAKVKSTGKNWKDFTKEQQDAVLARVLASGKFREQAERVVAARQAEASIDLDL
jgi:hypothetical protein